MQSLGQAVPAGRCLDQPEIRRHRAWAGDQSETARSAWRITDDRQHAWAGNNGARHFPPERVMGDGAFDSADYAGASAICLTRATSERRAAAASAASAEQGGQLAGMRGDRSEHTPGSDDTARIQRDERRRRQRAFRGIADRAQDSERNAVTGGNASHAPLSRSTAAAPVARYSRCFSAVVATTASPPNRTCAVVPPSNVRQRRIGRIAFVPDNHLGWHDQRAGRSPGSSPPARPKLTSAPHTLIEQPRPPRRRPTAIGQPSRRAIRASAISADNDDRYGPRAKRQNPNATFRVLARRRLR